MHGILASALWHKAGLFRAAKRAWCGGIMAMALLSSGCSTVDFAYSMGPTALTLMADNYLDLDADQETLLKERILVLREWGRTAQLADVSKLLLDVRARAGGRIGTEDLVWLTDEGRKRWGTMAPRLAAEIVDLAPRLTPDNINALNKKLARNNDEYVKENIEVAPEKLRDRRFERFKENFERWYGNLDETQSARLRVLSDALPANPRLVLEDRKRRQQAFVAALQMAMDKSTPREQATARLVTLLTDWERGRAPAYQAFAEAWLAQSRNLTVEIVNLSSSAQRETAQRRFKRWADDLAGLASRKDP